MHISRSVFIFPQNLCIRRTVTFLIFISFTATALAQTDDKKKIEEQLLAKARQNIETYRKGDAAITFTNAQGKPVENVSVTINQQTQDFLFGNLSKKYGVLTDRFIWLQGGGLLGEAFHPKPMYNRLMKLIEEDWITKNIKIFSDKKGTVTFGGFYGN